MLLVTPTFMSLSRYVLFVILVISNVSSEGKYCYLSEDLKRNDDES